MKAKLIGWSIVVFLGWLLIKQPNEFSALLKGVGLTLAGLASSLGVVVANLT